jgi:hypothetical protein
VATITVFTLIPRLAGDVGSPSAPGPYVTSPASYAGTATSVTWQITSLTWATDDPSIVVTTSLDLSTDGGTTWAEVYSVTNSPQQFNPKGGGLPSGQVPSNLLGSPAEVRVRLGLSGTLTMGMTATIT